jgi:hypothetical protein
MEPTALVVGALFNALVGAQSDVIFGAIFNAFVGAPVPNPSS